MDSRLLLVTLIAIYSSAVEGAFVGTSFPEGFPERRLITVQSSFGVADTSLRHFEPMRRRSGSEETPTGASPKLLPPSPRGTSAPVTFPFRSRATPSPSVANLTSPQSFLLSSSRKKNAAFLPSAVLRRGRPSRGGGGGGGVSVRIRRGGGPAQRSLRRRRSPGSHSQPFQSPSISKQSPSFSDLPQVSSSPEGQSPHNKHHHKEAPHEGGYDGALSAQSYSLAHATGVSPHVAHLPPLLPQKSSQVSHLHPRHSQPHLIQSRGFLLHQKPLLFKKKPLQAPFLPLYVPPPPQVAPKVPVFRHPYPLTFDRSQEKNRYEEADRLAPLNALSSKVSKLEFDLNNLKKSTRLRLKTQEETEEENTRNINFVTYNGWRPILKAANHVGVTTPSATPPPSSEPPLLSTPDHSDGLDLYSSPQDGLRETRSHNESRTKQQPRTTRPPPPKRRLRFAKKHKPFQPDFFITDSSGDDNRN